MAWTDLFWGVRYLRSKCFIIGYLNLIASTVDLACHLVILSMVTNFFSCDVDLTALRNINWPWLEQFLIIINLGTHGFYPSPLVLTYYDGVSLPTTPRCYPGMLHIYLIDLINLLVQVVWLRIVVYYIEALHKKDPERMRMFVSLSVVKILLQALYFGYNPFFYSEMFFETCWFITIIDFCVAVYFLLLINSYTRMLRAEKSTPAAAEANQPPSYIECLMHTQNETNEKPPQIAVDIERKIEI